MEDAGGELLRGVVRLVVQRSVQAGGADEGGARHVRRGGCGDLERRSLIGMRGVKLVVVSEWHLDRLL